jgi:hypothetical protein
MMHAGAHSPRGIQHAALSLHFIAKRQIHLISKVSKSAAAERHDTQESGGLCGRRGSQIHFNGRVRAGVLIRLLTRDLISQLVASVEAFVQQHGATIQIRTSQAIHGRFLSLDRGSRSFLIDASFKDAGATSPVALIELTDTAATSLAQYEAIWQASTVVRA